MSIYLVRQFNGELFLFRKKPIKKFIGSIPWFTTEDQEEWEDGSILLKNEEFPDVTYENSPIEVKLIKA